MHFPKIKFEKKPIPTIKFKQLDKKAELPQRGSNFAAGYDLVAVTGNHIISIKAGETVKVKTGLAIEIPDGYFGAIFARSGFATKLGLRPANCVGVIDSDYRGEIIVALHNDSNVDRYVVTGDRIAQLIIMPFLTFNQVWSTDLTNTDRGSGGFGSTGRNW